MIIPIGNSGNIRRIPYITIVLIIINIIVFFSISSTVKRDNIRVNNAYRKYVDLVFDLYINYEGLSPQYIMEHFDSLMNSVLDSSVYSNYKQYNKIIQAKQNFEKTKAEHIYMKYGLTRDNLSLFTLISSIFMHAGLFHLIGNIWFLLLLGANLEDTYGRILFLIFYIISGIIASLIFVFSQSNTQLPLIGASGAIAGVMGAFSIRHFSTKIKFFYLFFPIKPLYGTFRIIAGFVLPLWFIQQIVNASGENSSGIAFMAHIGGYFFGLLIAILIEYFKIEERYIKPRIEEATNILGLSIKQQNGIEAYYNNDYSKAIVLLKDDFIDRPRMETFVPFIDSLIKSGKEKEVSHYAGIFMEKLNIDNDNIRFIYDMLLENSIYDYLNPVILFNLAKKSLSLGYIEEGIDLFRKIINNKKSIIIGAKSLKYLFDNNLYYDKMEEDLLQYSKIDEVSDIINSIKKER